MANRYSRALKQIKDKTLDEKLELLSEIPTNNASGLYVDTPGHADPEEIVPGDIDSPLNLEEDGQGQEGYTGNDTTGLFMADGTIRSVEPPGDTSYILGPMSSMWYAWANYTQIGYIRQSDRKMVNLGRITGELADWDGETGFTGYGQMTIEQVVWFKNITRVNDYRAFYPGPPSSTPDEYGRYLCSITGESKSATKTIPENPFKRYTPGTNTTGDPSDNYASQVARGEVPVPPIPRGNAEYDLVSELIMLGLSRGIVMALTGLATVAKTEVAKTLQLWKATGPSVTKTVPKIKINHTGPTKAQYGGPNYKSPSKVKDSGTGPWTSSSYNPNKPGGGPARKRFPSGESYQSDGELIVEGIEELPVELIHIVNTIIAEIGNKPEDLDKLIKLLNKGTSVKESKEVLSENRKRILRDIKKPVQVKEIPSKVKVSPKLRNKNKTVGVDMMKIPDTPAQYKPQTNIWGKADYAANVRASQERKNEVLELVGAAEHHWTYLTEESKRKKQEKVNEMAAAEYDKEMELLYEKHRIKEDKISKVRSLLSDSKFVYDKLDPHSAEAMPPTGDPEIDANIKKATNAKEKARKLKILQGKTKRG